jgi:hypothetical protein
MRIIVFGGFDHYLKILEPGVRGLLTAGAQDEPGLFTDNID